MRLVFWKYNLEVNNAIVEELKNDFNYQIQLEML